MGKELDQFFKQLNRALFIEGEYKELSYLDSPLPIGFDQTISQPSLVLYMTQALEVDATHRVLEIGTGSGYQTALLAQFAKEVYTVERIAALSESAQTRLAKMGYKNVFFSVTDGSVGWSEFAPFDRIMVTASPSTIPNELVDQLALRGKMVIPVGSDLLLIERHDDNSITKQILLQVAFVPLVGKYS